VIERSSGKNIFKWYKNIGVNLSSGNFTLELGLTREYNIQYRFGTWDVNIGLPNHAKNQASKFFPRPICFKQFSYGIGYCV